MVEEVSVEESGEKPETVGHSTPCVSVSFCEFIGERSA